MTDRSRPQVLAVDDDTVWLEQIPLILERDAEVTVAATIDQGLKVLEEKSFDVILLDLNFADDLRTGMDVFRRIHAIGCEADVIVISGEVNAERLVSVFNAGVTRFITKPAHPDRVRQDVRRVLEQRDLRLRALAGVLKGVADPFVGSSPAVLKLRQQVDLVLKSGAKDILLQGETGVGKEVLARYIAKYYDRSGRLLPVHCGAISDGLVESELFGHVKGAFTGADRDRLGVFEAANGGVVFLDEIGEMPLHQQAKLLRVLQERKVQRVGSHEERTVFFRSISATNVDLRLAVAQGDFREDLYYRVGHAVIQIPPLRARPGDIPAFVSLIVADMGARLEFESGALGLLQAYEWPGNIRQLDSVVRSIAFRAKAGVVRERDVCASLPELADRTPGLKRTYAFSLIQAERKRFEDALAKSKGYRDDAAKLLGLSRATFYRRARELGLLKERRSTDVLRS